MFLKTLAVTVQEVEQHDRARLIEIAFDGDDASISCHREIVQLSGEKKLATEGVYVVRRTLADISKDIVEVDKIELSGAQVIAALKSLFDARRVVQVERQEQAVAVAELPNGGVGDF